MGVLSPFVQPAQSTRARRLHDQDGGRRDFVGCAVLSPGRWRLRSLRTPIRGAGKLIRDSDPSFARKVETACLCSRQARAENHPAWRLALYGSPAYTGATIPSNTAEQISTMARMYLARGDMPLSWLSTVSAMFINPAGGHSLYAMPYCKAINLDMKPQCIMNLFIRPCQWPSKYLAKDPCSHGVVSTEHRGKRVPTWVSPAPPASHTRGSWAPCIAGRDRTCVDRTQPSPENCPDSVGPFGNS